MHHVSRLAEELKKYDVVILNDTPYAQSILGLLPDTVVTVSVLHNAILSMVSTVLGNSSNCDRIVTVSPGLRDLLSKGFNVNLERISCICNGVAVPTIWQKQGTAIDGDRINIGFVGRLEENQKGVLLIPKILSRLKYLGNIDKLSIIGDGPDRVEMECMLGEMCPGLNYEYYGMLPNDKTIGLLKEQDILIMPSYYEGLPIVLLEAMGQGVVPVVSRLGGFTDPVVSDGENGILVEVGDVDGFAGAIDDIIKDKHKRMSMSQAAWHTVSSKFSEDIMGRQYLSMIRQLSETRNSKEVHMRRHEIDWALLGDLPCYPLMMVRIMRKLLRMCSLWPSEYQKNCTLPGNVVQTKNGRLELRNGN